MPLSPSPEERVMLEHTLSAVWIARWDDGEQRELVVIPYETDPALTDTGPYIDGAPDYEHAAQLITVDELDELVQALRDQREWLAGQEEGDSAVWVVTTIYIDDENMGPMVQGPFSRAKADRLATEAIQSPDAVAQVIVCPLNTD